MYSIRSGSIAATPFSAVISDRLGRRKCMFVGAWIIIAGSIIIATANHLPQFYVGRVVLGFGIQVMVVSAPAYAVEIAPPHWRGRAVGESPHKRRNVINCLTE
jgi:MFS family permease